MKKPIILIVVTLFLIATILFYFFSPNLNSSDLKESTPQSGLDLDQSIFWHSNYQTAITQAQKENKLLLIDFYADWCVSCKEMEAFTFTDPKVAEQMSRSMLLRADVTKNDKLDRGLLKRFGLFGPPAILFFSPQGQETRNGRVVGFMNKSEFYDHLMAVYDDMSIQVQASNNY